MKTSETLARRWLASKHWGGWRFVEGPRVYGLSKIAIEDTEAAALIAALGAAS